MPRPTPTPVRKLARRTVVASYLFGLLLFSALIGIVARLGDLERFVDLVQRVDLRWLFACAVLQAGTYVCEGMAWKAFLDRCGHRRHLGELLPLSIAKLFADQAVPSAGISGSAFFLDALHRRGVPPATALACALYEAAAHFAAGAVLAGCSLLVLADQRGARHWLLATTGFFIASQASVPLALWYLRRHGRMPAEALARRLPRLQDWIRLARDAAAARPPRARLFAGLVVLRAAIVLLDAATLWTILRGLGLEAPFARVFSGFVTASMAMSLSPVPLGLGPFEATCVAMLHGAGIGVEAGLAATLLLRGMTTWLPMLPGVWLVRREMREAGDNP